MDFGRILKAARQSRGLKQSELGAIVELSEKAISTYENGTREPKLSVLIKFADELDMSLDQLVGRCNRRQNDISALMQLSNLEEQSLIQMFRALSEEDKLKVKAIIKTLSEMGKLENSSEKNMQNSATKKNPETA